MQEHFVFEKTNAITETAPRVLLLMDDEPNVLSALIRLLRPCGFRMFTAPNAVQALDIMSRHDVGVVMSDHRMPGMTGIELLSSIRAIKPAVRRFMLSGCADHAAVSAALANGTIEQFLDKPWDGVALCAALSGAFEQDACLTPEITQVHESEAVLMRGSVKFGGLGKRRRPEPISSN